MFLSEESHQQRTIVPATTSKREQYRQQIRKNNLRARFKQIRDAIVEQDDLAALQTTLGQLAQSFSDCDFKEALTILQGHEESANFNNQVGKLRLQVLLVELLQKYKERITIPEASQLISALNSLTYYSNTTSALLTENVDFIDDLRVEMEQLDMQNLDNLLHIKTIIVFLMNTTSQLVTDYNNYLAESDISKVINIQLAKTVEVGRQHSQQYKNVAFQAREYCLRMYCNIVNSIDNQGHVPARLVGDVLRDQEYLLRHPERTFVLLSQAMKNQHFWPCLMADRDCVNFCSPICEAIDSIQQRCFKDEFLLNKDNHLTSDEANKFYTVILFMNQLFDQEDDHEISWSRMVENVLNGFMLGEFLIQAHKRKEAKHIIQALKLFVRLSRTYEVTGEQLIIVRPADDPLELLKVFTDINLLKGYKTGPACLEILAGLLKKDRNFLAAVMEFRMLDLLAELFETKEESQAIMERAIELCLELIICEKELKELREDKRMYALMQTKGIVRTIGRLYDCKEKQVFIMAEMFSDETAEYKK